MTHVEYKQRAWATCDVCGERTDIVEGEWSVRPDITIWTALAEVEKRATLEPVNLNWGKIDDVCPTCQATIVQRQYRAGVVKVQEPQADKPEVPF